MVRRQHGNSQEHVTKHIFVTGGVVSSLGKGLTASSLGRLLRSRGIKVIIAGAGGAAHLPGMVAAKTTLPVIGVPVKSRALSGVGSLYSIVQMPGGVPVATMAIGEAGATNAALFALRLLSVEDKAIAEALANFAEEQGKIAEESTNELN